jgi:hypothetical protein
MMEDFEESVNITKCARLQEAMGKFKMFQRQGKIKKILKVIRLYLIILFLF